MKKFDYRFKALNIGSAIAKISNKTIPFIKEKNIFPNTLNSFIESQNYIGNIVNRGLLKFVHTVVKLENNIKPKYLDYLPKKTRRALIILGNNGWFLDLEMSLRYPFDLEKLFKEKNIIDAEKVLIEYFKKRLTEIEESIITKFPKRTKIINSAFKAHTRGEYELSIPVLLTQVDGICNEITNQHYFRKENKKPRTAKYVKKIVSNTYLVALLAPLAQTLPIGMSENERKDDFGELNRHMVLHGDSLEYGTEVNGLKVISLINSPCNSERGFTFQSLTYCSIN